MKESESEVAQSCLTLCDPMDCSPPGSSVHGIFQARVLEWVAISFSRGSSQPRDRTQVSRIAGRHFTVWATRKPGRGSITVTKTRPGTNCGSDHELLIAKFRLKLKKVGKTIRSFRYDLNQTPYDYTVEVTNRFKGLDLIDRKPEELWTKVCNMYRRQWSRPSPRKRNARRQNGCLRRSYR